MHMRTRRLALAAAVAAVAVTAILSSPGAARGQSSQGARDARKAEMESRQKALWSLEGVKRRPPAGAADNRPSYREVAEDFEQLQLRNYELSGAAGPGPEPDYARVRREAAEVRKRAARLKAHLSLPEPEKAQKPKKGGEILTLEELRAAVAALDALVKSFVWNPVFQRSGQLDAQQSAQAGRDLEGILRLSEQIRKCAEALGKAAGKNF